MRPNDSALLNGRGEIESTNSPEKRRRFDVRFIFTFRTVARTGFDGRGLADRTPSVSYPRGATDQNPTGDPRRLRTTSTEPPKPVPVRGEGTTRFPEPCGGSRPLPLGRAVWLPSGACPTTTALQPR